MPMCLDLCSLHALCHLPCACMLHAMLVCLGLDLFVMPCAIAAILFLLSHFLVFWHLVRARSRPYGLCHHPYTLVYIKGFGSPIFHVCACLLLCFMLVLASLVLSFATFDAFSGFVVVCLDSMPFEALFGCSHLGCIAMMPVASCTLIPFSAPCDDCLSCFFMPPVGFICIFTRLFTCSCMSLAC